MPSLFFGGGWGGQDIGGVTANTEKDRTLPNSAWLSRKPAPHDPDTPHPPPLLPALTASRTHWSRPCMAPASPRQQLAVRHRHRTATVMLMSATLRTCCFTLPSRQRSSSSPSHQQRFLIGWCHGRFVFFLNQTFDVLVNLKAHYHSSIVNAFLSTLMNMKKFGVTFRTIICMCSMGVYAENKS